MKTAFDEVPADASGNPMLAVACEDSLHDLAHNNPRVQFCSCPYIHGADVLAHAAIPGILGSAH